MRYLRKFENLSLVVGRFIPGIRLFVVPLVGLGSLPYLQFLLWDTTGAVLWSGLWSGLGLLWGHQWRAFYGGVRKAQQVLLLLMGAAVIGFIAYKLVKRRRQGKVTATDVALAASRETGRD